MYGIYYFLLLIYFFLYVFIYTLNYYNNLYLLIDLISLLYFGRVSTSRLPTPFSAFTLFVTSFHIIFYCVDWR